MSKQPDFNQVAQLYVESPEAQHGDIELARFEAMEWWRLFQLAADLVEPDDEWGETMSDDVSLREALKFYGHPDSYTGHEQVVLSAALKVLDSEEAWRCETHRCDAIPRLGGDPDRCWKGEFVRHLSIADCSMVRARVTAPEVAEHLAREA